MTTGTLKFGPIPTLGDRWWDDPESVWRVWDRNAYYLWGANGGNYRRSTLGEIIGGGGLAGPRGPTRGRAHPRYVGICTMGTDEIALNGPVFEELGAKLTAGATIVAPTYQGKLSLGTGIGATRPGASESVHRDWLKIQGSILSELLQLGRLASGVRIPEGTYWPDCTKADVTTMRPTDPHAHGIRSLDDLEAIASHIASRIGSGTG